jgi:predicted Holliday junction resolvase-like endonuclease
MLYTSTVILLLLSIGGVYYHFKRKIKILKLEFENQKAIIRRDAKKRSGAVQWGKTIEHFVPFMSEFPVPPEDCTFLGMPIDYVGFTDTASKTKCSVHFVEVKSGSSFLMGKQKNIKKAIEEGRVHWHEISVDGNNVK